MNHNEITELEITKINKSKNELLFITGNKDKIKEIKYLLKPYNINLIIFEINLAEIQSNDKKEVVREKINEALKHPYLKDKKFIVEDSSLELDELNGFPGPLIKFMEEKIGLDGLYNIVKGKNTKARFYSTIGYRDCTGIYIISDCTEGDLISYNDNVIHNVGIEPIFKPIGYDKSYGDIELREERYKIGPRSKNIAKLVDFINKI